MICAKIVDRFDDSTIFGYSIAYSTARGRLICIMKITHGGLEYIYFTGVLNGKHTKLR